MMSYNSCHWFMFGKVNTSEFIDGLVLIDIWMDISIAFFRLFDRKNASLRERYDIRCTNKPRRVYSRASIWGKLWNYLPEKILTIGLLFMVNKTWFHWLFEKWKKGDETLALYSARQLNTIEITNDFRMLCWCRASWVVVFYHINKPTTVLHAILW